MKTFKRILLMFVWAFCFALAAALAASVWLGGDFSAATSMAVVSQVASKMVVVTLLGGLTGLMLGVIGLLPGTRKI
jgi:hypothetical protein